MRLNMKNLSEKLYEEFSVKQRIDLTLAAFIRDDESEANRLKRTCTKKRYLCTDASYQEPIQKFLHHTLLFTILFQSYYGELKECEAYIFIGSALVFGYEQGFDLAISGDALSHPAWETLEKKQTTLMNSFQKQKERRKNLIAKLKALNQAYLFFSEGLKLNVDDASAYWKKTLLEFCPRLEEYLNSNIDPDSHLLEEIKANLLIHLG